MQQVIQIPIFNDRLQAIPNHLRGLAQDIDENPDLNQIVTTDDWLLFMSYINKLAGIVPPRAIDILRTSASIPLLPVIAYLCCDNRKISDVRNMYEEIGFSWYGISKNDWKNAVQFAIAYYNNHADFSSEDHERDLQMHFVIFHRRFFLFSEYALFPKLLPNQLFSNIDG